MGFTPEDAAAATAIAKATAAINNAKQRTAGAALNAASIAAKTIKFPTTLPDANGKTYPNHCASSNERNLTLSCDLILKCANFSV